MGNSKNGEFKISKPRLFQASFLDNVSTMNTVALAGGTTRLAIGLVVALMTLSLGRVPASDGTNQFLFLTLRLKGGTVTLEKASVVSGTLKPQQDSTDAEPLFVTLEPAEGEARWSLAIDDPSIQRYEYEDPQQSGVLKSKLVQVDDVEFVVRAPLTPGVRHIAIHRKEKSVQPAKAGALPAAKTLLARIELPKEVTK
jgi:hypothetical protein